MPYTLLLLLLSLLLALPAEAQPPVPADGVVSRVVVQGNRRVEDATVFAAVGLRRGEELTAARIRRDLRAVWATGFFDDVVVSLVETEDGIVVVFEVREKPAVREVRVSGNRRIDESDIHEVIDMRAFAVLNEAELRANVERVRDLYVEKGFYLAEIEPRIVPVAQDVVEVVLEITENRKVVVQRIEFSGNHNVPSGRIKRFMQTKEGGIAPWLTNTGAFRQDVLDQDMLAVRQIFMEEGFLEVQVDPPNVYLSPDQRFIYISVNVDEGPRYHIRDIDVAGDFVPEEGLTRDAVLEIIGGRQVADVQEEQWRVAHDRRRPPFTFEARGPALEPGEVFRLSALQMVQAAITDFYSDQGYAFVNVVPLPETDPETETVDIRFEIDRGEKVRIGRIHITGNDPTFDKVVRREILVNEGDIYRGSRLKASRARLARLGFFRDVSISTPRGEGDNVLDVNVGVEEQPTGTFSLGLGFSSLEQFMFTANVSKNNFLGMGYMMSAAVNWSALSRQWQLMFMDPYFLDSRWMLSVNAYSMTREYQLDEYQRGGSFSVGRYLDARDDLQVRLTYTIEDVGLTTIDPYRARLLGGDLFRNGLTSSVGASFILDKRNNRLFPTRGVYFSAATDLAGGFRVGDQLLSTFGGDFNFVESKLNFRFYQPVVGGDQGLIFRMNSTAGFINSTDGRVIPYIHRYRAGGINSMRGYDWYSLGPTMRVVQTDDPAQADASIVVGGTQLWVNNLELQAPIVAQAGIHGVVFFDAGNAFGDPWGEGAINPLRMRFAYGAGVRWQSPLGLLRFEWGFPVAPQEGERRSVFDFGIGSFF